jgi:hypothetical protein
VEEGFMLKIANRIVGESITAKAIDQEAVSISNTAQTAITSREYYRDKFEEVQKNKEARDEKSGGSLFGTIFHGPLVGTRVGEPIADKTDDKKNELRDMISKASEEIKKLEADLANVYDSSFVATGDWFSGRDKGAEFQGESNVNQVTARKRTTRSSSGSDDD